MKIEILGASFYSLAIVKEFLLANPQT